jgi:putative CocE/NonD family hydrolase
MSTAIADLPHKVKVIEHFWITLKDGTRLAARMWLPEDAEKNPVPAVLEYIPYRKRDGTRTRDEPMHGYFAGHGYAAIRVDQRGSGESDGLMHDEYAQQEQDDALEVIDWIAQQKWCSGSVGMMGKSWGGFNCLQVAALRPSALKAILSVCSTDDRYADDIHYMGGCLLNDNHWWGDIMLAYQARPADPELFGPTWRENWLTRLNAMPFWPALWMQNQRRNAYWKHGSICEDWSAIQCPVFLIGGWVDAYTNAIPRMLENLQVPRKAVIGPWAHLYPQDGAPAPAIGFLQEAVKWWDHWLKGKKTDTLEGPMLRAWLQDYTEPTTSRSAHPGRWVGEDQWPSANISNHRLHFGNGSLAKTAGADTALSICSPQTLGIACGEWMAVGCDSELPGDQRLDDGGALVFDTAALDQQIDVLGAPVLELDFASDKPVAQLCARLSDVAPDGKVLRVSYQVFNLTHRDSHEHPTALEPGKRYKLRLKLNDCGHRFAPGHRIRVALSTAYWPMIWPSPERATLTVYTGASAIVLPQRKPRADDGGNPFLPPETAPLTPLSKVTDGKAERYATVDMMTGLTTYVTRGEGSVFGGGATRFDEIGTVQDHCLTRYLTIGAEDPNSARYKIEQSYELGRPGWQVRIETVTEMTSTKENFILTGRLDAYEGETRVASRNWHETVKRDLL